MAATEVASEAAAAAAAPAPAPDPADTPSDEGPTNPEDGAHLTVEQVAALKRDGVEDMDRLEWEQATQILRSLEISAMIREDPKAMYVPELNRLREEGAVRVVFEWKTNDKGELIKTRARDGKPAAKIPTMVLEFLNPADGSVMARNVDPALTIVGCVLNSAWGPKGNIITAAERQDTKYDSPGWQSALKYRPEDCGPGRTQDDPSSGCELQLWPFPTCAEDVVPFVSNSRDVATSAFFEYVDECFKRFAVQNASSFVKDAKIVRTFRLACEAATAWDATVATASASAVAAVAAVPTGDGEALEAANADLAAARADVVATLVAERDAAYDAAVKKAVGKKKGKTAENAAKKVVRAVDETLEECIERLVDRNDVNVNPVMGYPLQLPEDKEPSKSKRRQHEDFTTNAVSDPDELTVRTFKIATKDGYIRNTKDTAEKDVTAFAWYWDDPEEQKKKGEPFDADLLLFKMLAMDAYKKRGVVLNYPTKVFEMVQDPETGRLDLASRTKQKPRIPNGATLAVRICIGPATVDFKSFLSARPREIVVVTTPTVTADHFRGLGAPRNRGPMSNWTAPSDVVGGVPTSAAARLATSMRKGSTGGGLGLSKFTGGGGGGGGAASAGAGAGFSAGQNGANGDSTDNPYGGFGGGTNPFSGAGYDATEAGAVEGFVSPTATAGPVRSPAKRSRETRDAEDVIGEEEEEEVEGEGDGGSDEGNAAGHRDSRLRVGDEEEEEVEAEEVEEDDS